MRLVLVALIGLLVAFQVVRTAMVRQAPLANAWWPAHPSALLAGAMAEIGAIAARGDRVPPDVLARVDQAARAAPLAPEPLLVRGALAQMEQRERTAEQLYAAAATRDPRSPAARYFLAERYLRTGRTDAALREMAVLSRLTTGAISLAPSIAEYARASKAVDQLRGFFRSAPEFEPAVLAHLAGDTRNLDLILALWSGPKAKPGSDELAWQTAIIGKLVAAGDYRRAHASWRRFARVAGAGQGIFNPEFREIAAPPPFNWTFGSAGGLAQPAGGGQLDVVYFGRDEAMLTQQLLLLPPGRYALRMQVNGDIQQGSGIAWTLVCPDKRGLMTLPILRPPAGLLQASFAVPQDCPAQQLQLTGSPGDFPRAIEFSLRRFELLRAPGR